MIRMRAMLAWTVLVAGCHHAAQDWSQVPPAPAIRFTETVPPGSIVVLVLDAHSGSPLTDALAMVPGSSLRAVTDSAGILRLRPSRPGPLDLNIRRVGYRVWHSIVNVPDSTGLALVVQLQRASMQVTPVCTTEARPGIIVTVVDSVTGDPPATATFIARSGAYVDSVMRSRAPIVVNGSPVLLIGTAVERPGTYDIVVRSPGYREWTRTGVRVTGDQCHVHLTELTARLQR